MPAPKWAIKCHCGAWLVSDSNAQDAKVTCDSCGWSYTKGDLVPVLRHPDQHYLDSPYPPK